MKGEINTSSFGKMLAGIILAFAVVIFLNTFLVKATYETDTYKDTGLQVNSYTKLCYDVDTNFVYECEHKARVGWVRKPYINEEGTVYKFNLETGEIYIDKGVE